MVGGGVMIEAACEALALVDGEIELELVGSARPRIRLDGVGDDGALLTELFDLALEGRVDAGGGVEKLRKLRKRDRLRRIEVARRMALAKELRQAGIAFRTHRGKRAQVDPPPGPGGPHRRQRSHHGGIGIGPADRIGMPAFGRSARGTGDRESPTGRGRRFPPPSADRSYARDRRGTGCGSR